MMIRNGGRLRAKEAASGEVAEAAIERDDEAATATAGIDASLMRKLARLLAESDLAELEIEKGDLRVRMVRYSPAPAPIAAALVPAPAPIPAMPVMVAPAAPVSATPAVPATDPDHPGAVKSPMVGTAYRRQSPESKTFVEVGSVVKAGEKVLLVEAMKTFNEIVAPRAGTVVAIFVEDGQPVEFGEPLLIID